MRFETLTIENYGRCKEARLVFPATPGFTLIFGPNEAGKSTALEAISDFLFGVPERTERGQMFGAGNIALSAQLTLADGTRLSLRRRKGRARTLTDQSGQPVEEAVLVRTLGATGRDRFNSLFGLSHEALRKGGDQLLKADGDVGRLILSAGGGLGSLVKIVDGLREDAAKLFDMRKGKDRLFYMGLSAFEEAEKAVKLGQMTREHYVKAQQQLNAARETEASLRRRRSEKMTEHLRFERLARVVPSILAFDRLSQEAVAFADLPPLRADFTASCTKALDAELRAGEALREAEERCLGAQRRLENLAVSIAVIEAEAKIRDAGEKAIHVSKARDDRPNREIELAEYAEALKTLRQRIGLPDDADLETAAPSAEAVERTQRLAAEGLERRGKLAGLAEERARETKTLEAAQKRQIDRRATGADRPIGLRAAEFSTITQLAAAHMAKAKQAEAAKQDFETALTRLGFATIEALQSWLCPDEAAIQAEIDRRGAIEAELLTAKEKIAAAAEKRDQAHSEAERLKAGAPMPSREAIESLRAQRNLVFDGIKARYLSINASEAAGRSQAEREADIEAHQKHAGSADALADRRALEADRVAALELAQRQEAEARRLLASLAQQQERLANERAAADEAWSAIWPEAATKEKNPGRLKALSAQRPMVLARHADWREKAESAAALEAEFSARLEALALAEARLGLQADGAMSARVSAIAAAIEIHEAAFADYRTDENIIAGVRARLADIDEAQKALLDAEANWRAAWRPALQALALPDGAAFESANDIATQWAKADGVFKGRRQTRHRLTRMDEDEAALRNLVEEIRGGLDFELPLDAVAAARLLADRLEEARKIRIERESAARQLAAEIEDRDGKRELAGAAAAVVRSHCEEAGCAPEALADFSVRFAQKVELEQQLRDLAKAIQEYGDAQPLEALREQWGGRNLDEIAAAAATFKSEADGLDAEINEAFAVRRDRERDLDAFASAEGVNAAVAERESAAAEMHDALERYIEIALAEELLRAAMDQLRDQQKDPLIRRAGDLFAVSTAGAFAGVNTDVNADGLPVVVGRRKTGEDAPVALMSDGVRDQLYLSFRIASIEHYAQAAEPLPFIADDLLVHFDDERSAAALGLLAELGKTTQVLLFTHHRSLKEAAAPLVEKNLAAILELCGT
ncbi:conserved hypothetical protein [Methylocella tundrae]|uniref:YhaN AAA domain-containing protein n=1 Tax=Methylocella tundrae TaxID=227605 RepID=A0A8B6MD36_METTU|nr:YhaN family protein [Methylocella tundrae]VTZ52318.1 conserved hypothetical protein [Methylocella tundrae]